MNSNDQICSPQTPPPAPETETHPWQPTIACAHRGNGNVARLPKSLRDQINNWMLDCVVYADIIGRLYQWKKRGHQDWLVEQSFIARTRAPQEASEDLVRDFDATQLNHAALQLGTLHIFEAFRDLGSGTLDQKLGGDSAAFARLLNARARTSRETLLLQKYREASAKASAALQALRDPNRKLEEKERRSLVLMVDNILGMPSIEDAPAVTEPDPVPDPVGPLPPAGALGPRLGEAQQLEPQSSETPR